MANEGLVRDPLLKMVHNPGGDWHPGRGDNPSYVCLYRRVGEPCHVKLGKFGSFGHGLRVGGMRRLNRS